MTEIENTKDDVAAALDGDREALGRVVGSIQPLIYRLALRFFGHPQDAEDASQEALIQIVTRLDRFEGRSALTTWAYRVATNKYLSMARMRNERHAMTFEEFDQDLAAVPLNAKLPSIQDVDNQLLLEEAKIGCTLAMLLCLDRGHRMAYVLGEIMEMDHQAGAEILDITPTAFRKRLQRARSRITDLMRARCGLFDPENACRCRLRVPVAIDLGRIDPHDLLYVSSAEQARRFPQVLHVIRSLDEAERAGALYRSHPEMIPQTNFGPLLDRIFRS